MKRQIRQLTTILIWIGVISSGLGAYILAHQIEWNYHTTPDKWREPRLFHTPFESGYENLLFEAVSAITGKAEDEGVESLSHRGGTALSKESLQGKLKKERNLGTRLPLNVEINNILKQMQIIKVTL